MFTCPYAALMPQTMSSRPWTINELISNFQCRSCYTDTINTWAPCVRLSAMVNVHPNLCSRERQIWFIIFIFLKYLPCGPQFTDEDFSFDGEHTVETHIYDPSSPNRRKMIPNVPKYLQCSPIITRGNIFAFIFYY